ncbi:MAG: hypothetical protein AMXMBFR49_24310 [Chlorobiota bacterium]
MFEDGINRGFRGKLTAGRAAHSVTNDEEVAEFTGKVAEKIFVKLSRRAGIADRDRFNPYIQPFAV